MDRRELPALLDGPTKIAGEVSVWSDALERWCRQVVELGPEAPVRVAEMCCRQMVEIAPELPATAVLEEIRRFLVTGEIGSLAPWGNLARSIAPFEGGELDIAREALCYVDDLIRTVASGDPMRGHVEWTPLDEVLRTAATPEFDELSEAAAVPLLVTAVLVGPRDAAGRVGWSMHRFDVADALRTVVASAGRCVGGVPAIIAAIRTKRA